MQLDIRFSCILETPATIDVFRVRNHRATITSRFLRSEGSATTHAHHHGIVMGLTGSVVSWNW